MLSYSSENNPNWLNNMEIDRITPRTKNPLHAFPIVDYKTCGTCGFRLMRVEPSPTQQHPYGVAHCPICGSTHDENGYTQGKKLSRKECQEAFDDWLASHGLNRSQLENIYRLPIENFFSSDISWIEIETLLNQKTAAISGFLCFSVYFLLGFLLFGSRYSSGPGDMKESLMISYRMSSQNKPAKAINPAINLE